MRLADALHAWNLSLCHRPEAPRWHRLRPRGSSFSLTLQPSVQRKWVVALLSTTVAGSLARRTLLTQVGQDRDAKAELAVAELHAARRAFEEEKAQLLQTARDEREQWPHVEEELFGSGAALEPPLAWLRFRTRGRVVSTRRFNLL